MVTNLHDIRTLLTSSGTHLTLHYYLLQSDSISNPVYGIKVLAISRSNSQSVTFSEEVLKISYSKSCVSFLLSQCVKYLVTPTDLFTALDILMTETL